jgi:hypothetical protein
MILDGLPREYFPEIQLIDDYHLNRKLGVLYEGKVGNGKLVVCSMDLVSDLDSRHVARQFRNSLIRYMISDDFDPCMEIDAHEAFSVLK